MKKKRYEYSVNIDMKWSQDYKIVATTASEAKRKAWEKFKQGLPKDLFELMAEKEGEV